MWAIMPCVTSCCAYCACEACKSILGGITRRTARIAYCGIFASSILLAWFMRDLIKPFLYGVPGLSELAYTWLGGQTWWYGPEAAMRTMHTPFLFFSFMALTTLGTESKSDLRDAWHHSAWGGKLLLYVVMLVISFVLPHDWMLVYADVARFGSSIFLLFQMILLLDFVYSWNEAWVAKDEDKWYIALLASSLCLYLASIVGVVLLYAWFVPSGDGCQFNGVAISFLLFLVLAMPLVSIHPQVCGSLLPASAISLYCVWVTFTALNSEPNGYACNTLSRHDPDPSAITWSSSLTLVVGLLTTLLSVTYSALRAGSSSTLSSEDATSPFTMVAEEDDNDEEAVTSNSSAPISYSYAFFHLVFALAAMYAAMLLTAWGSSASSLPTDEYSMDVGWPSVYVKLSSALAAALLYIWTLVAPIVLPDREFR